MRAKCQQLQVRVEGPGEVALRRGPAGEDGAHAFAYNTRTPGAYSITATVGGAHVRGSPARVSASVAEAHAPLCEVVGGAGLERGAVAGARPPVAYTLNPVCCRVDQAGTGGK